MLNWTDNETTGNGFATQGFTVERDGAAVPGAFWRPANVSGKVPTVLMGHGGNGNKRNERMVMLGEMFSSKFGWCALSIDGPIHGDRGGIGNSSSPEYREMWKRPNIVQSMIADWQAVLDAALQHENVDSSRIGYWGQSMGTMFGLPFVASEPRVKAAVLGKAGMTGSSVTRSNIAPSFEEYAPKVTQPVLFNMQWDDERFDRAGQLDLYDRIGSVDKRLHAFPGEHVDNGPEAFEVQAEFLQRYL